MQAQHSCPQMSFSHYPGTNKGRLLLVVQNGGACHTGRRSCFYNASKGDEIVVLNDHE